MKQSKVKFCGFTRQSDVLLADHLAVDFVGLVFASSQRRVSIDQAKKILNGLSSRVERIGIFVDENIDTVLQTVEAVGLTGVQLHGQETTEYAQKIKSQRPDLCIIKTFEVDSEFHESAWAHFTCDYFLFDSPRKNSTIRQPLQIERLRDVKFDRPFFIAGGLNLENVQEAIAAINPFGVDVSSGIESSPGIKDAHAMTHFISAVSGRTS